jgi:hypothetical protein
MAPDCNARPANARIFKASDRLSSASAGDATTRERATKLREAMPLSMIGRDKE